MRSQTDKDLHKVFVYGTLKRGEPNHIRFSEGGNGYYKFLCEARTKEKYPLIIGTKYNVPFLLCSPGNGTFVKGEVYAVDDIVFKKLDILEEYPDFYSRELYDVIPLTEPNNELKVWVYLIKNFKDNLLNEPFYESYSSLGTHGRKYVESDNSTLDELNTPDI